MLTLTVCEGSIQALKRACIAIRGENSLVFCHIPFFPWKLLRDDKNIKIIPWNCNL